MTRDIGKMDTPPYGTPIQPMADQITPVETPSGILRKAGPQVADTLDDIYVLGEYFAKPRAWPDGVLADYFRPDQQNYLGIAGGIDLNKRFVIPFRQLVEGGGGVGFDEFHGIVGRLGASFYYSKTGRDLIKNYDAWHDVILKSFFLDMLQLSNQSAGETLARIWKYNMDNFIKTTSLLRSISTLPRADDYTRAAALSVYGYTARFFAQCHKTYTQGAIDDVKPFQTHESPIVATSAMFSFRALSGVIR